MESSPAGGRCTALTSPVSLTRRLSTGGHLRESAVSRVSPIRVTIGLIGDVRSADNKGSVGSGPASPLGIRRSVTASDTVMGQTDPSPRARDTRDRPQKKDLQAPRRTETTAVGGDRRRAGPDDKRGPGPEQCGPGANWSGAVKQWDETIQHS